MLWQRGLAFCIDYALAACMALILLLPLENIFPNRLYVEVPFQPTAMYCDELSTLPLSVKELIAAEDILRSHMCRYTSIARLDRYVVFAVVSETQHENSTTSVQMRVPVDAHYQPITPIAPAGFVTLIILILASAYLTKRDNPSPGKRLLNIKVSGHGCALCRELRRLTPILLLSTVTLVLSMSHRTCKPLFF
jgi:uncharacterized RDD family membrane protein YckC